MKNYFLRTSLVVQELRLHPSTVGAQVQSLAKEIPLATHVVQPKKKRENNFLLWLVVEYEKLDLVNRITLLWETPSPKESSAVARTAECQCCYSKRATEFAASWSFVLPPSAPRLGWWYMYISF